MKHILRKLHIGGNVDGGRPLDGRSPDSRVGEIRQNLLPSTSSPSTARPRLDGQTGGVNTEATAFGGGRTGTGSTGTIGGEDGVTMDFNYFEEEYQVQLALAISASNTENRYDPESLQIKAAKRISLGRSPSPGNTPAEFLAHRYWNFNVLDYDEKVMDGFYDVYGILSDPSSQGKMPSLVDLQGTPVSDNMGYEVVLVDRVSDPALEQLEQRALCIALECGSAELGPLDSDLVQRIADLVAEHMGGPVSDADDMLTSWTVRSYKLRASLNNIVLPLGCLQIGLSRHRALLFKVLADRVGIPCRLVKGSHYTGTDDGAINIIKLDHEREFIIDLMGAPGALIPAEIPSTVSAQNPVIDNLSSVAQAVQDLCLALEDKGDCQPVDIKERKNVSKYDSANGCERNDGRLSFEEAAMTALDSSANDAKVIERHRVHLIETGPTELNRPLNRTRRSPSWTEGAASPAEQMKVKDVSQYVMNAAKENPDFAQRLHAVLLESGVPAPPHLFADISSQQVAEQKLIKQKGFAEETRVNDFQRRRQKIPLGPGRPPQPISRQKSSICNGGIGEKSQVDLVEGMGLRRSFEASDSNVSPLTAISASHDPHSPVPGISNIIGTHVSLIPSSSGTPAAFGQNCIQESLPVAATAAVVAASVVVATSKCDETPIETPMAVAANIVASASVANQKHTEVHCVFSRNFVGKECPYNRVKAKELSESERKVHSGHEGQEHINDGLVGARGNSEHELAYSTTAYNSRQDSLMDDVAEWEIPWEDLLIGERIGLGSYGEVYHADWNGTEVAVKKFLDQDFSGDALEQFRSEVRIMRRLRHPNVVLFMGAVTRPPNLSILTEYLPRGSLYRLIHRPNLQIDEKRRLRMALDVAKGMNYLHTSNPTIVHRDLKSPNLLVDKNWVVKVCDFGLSRLKHHTFLSSKSTAGTPEWMAPEVLRNEPSNEKCDVYSFGVILWELATLRMPWSGMNPMQVVGAVGFQNRRLDIPKEIDPLAARIICECWQNDPSLRPSFGQLMTALKPLQRLVISPQSNTLSPIPSQ